jgi:hypothetical protein
MLFLEDVDPSKIMISAVMSEARTLFNGAVVSHPFVELYYEKPGQALRIVLRNVKSFNGIQFLESLATFFCSLQIPKAYSKKLQEIEMRIGQLLYDIRYELLREYENLSKMVNPSDIHFLLRSIVHEAMQAGCVTCSDDQIITLVPTTRYHTRYATNAKVECLEHKDCHIDGMGIDLAQVTIELTCVKYDGCLIIVTQTFGVVHNCNTTWKEEQETDNTFDGTGYPETWSELEHVEVANMLENSYEQEACSLEGL